MAHTPGPWATKVPPSSCGTDRWIVAERETGHNPVIAEVGSRFGEHDSIDIHEHVANARLIAAAPALLEACKAFLARFDTVLGRVHTDLLFDAAAKQITDFVFDNIAKQARSALALALAEPQAVEPKGN